VELWRTLSPITLSAVGVTVNFATGFPQCCAVLMAIAGVNLTGDNGKGAIGAFASASGSALTDDTVSYKSQFANTLEWRLLVKQLILLLRRVVVKHYRARRLHQVDFLGPRV
jgi:hypothetical protein